MKLTEMPEGALLLPELKRTDEFVRLREWVVLHLPKMRRYAGVRALAGEFKVNLHTAARIWLWWATYQI